MFQPEIVDLFAGPGGLDVAARWLDVPVAGIEWDQGACATRNAEELATHMGDVRDFKPGDFKNANVLVGGPPCQTYTVAGNGAGRRALDNVRRFAQRMARGDDVTAHLDRLEDVRTGLVLEPLRWALEAKRTGRPYDVIVLEQVPAVLPVWEAMRTILQGEGYSAECGVLHAEEYGVPQTRRRAILVARLKGNAALPTPTHRRFQANVPRDAGDQSRLPWRTMGDVLDRPEWFEIVSNYGTGGDPKARGRRTSDQPAFTVTGKISRNKILRRDGRSADPDRFTHAEAGLLQTFPSTYKWTGKDIAQQIGNAVPPRLAAHVLAAALDLGHEPLRKIFPDLAELDEKATAIRTGQISAF
ncbi:DNA cytosine methyltransferase [Streptosporangiaceae bacterium NEAU-GS5]|nr:DNA cytosine methyltransferase [Streptosporangiaceae bacterium NEAU-GS5]